MSIIQFTERVARNAWRIPILRQFLAADYARFFATRPANRFRGAYSSFSAAEASIPSGQRVGYDHEELAGMYRLRMEKACQSDYGMLFWLRDLIGPATLLFDFGGHVGVSYYGWKRYLNYPRGMRWRVYEVPAIVREGQELAAQSSSDGLEFTSDLAAGRNCTIFMAAGSLQYVDMSLPDVLSRIGTLPPHLFVNKMPLYDGESFVTVQSTGRAFHPYRIYNRAEFVSGLTALGYEVVDDWSNREQHCEIPHTRGRDIDAYSGYYFRLKAPSIP